MECSRKYYLASVLGYAPKDRNVHLEFGIIFQKADELFAKARIIGRASHDEALREVVRYALCASSPWPFTHPLKNRSALIRAIIWYHDAHRDDPFKTITLKNGQPAVELSFRMEVDNRLLCGHLDRLGELAGPTFFKDIKTTSSGLGQYFFQKYDLDVQMDIYSIATRIIYNTPVAGGLIDGIQIGPGYSKFERGFTHRTPDQLEEALQNFRYRTGPYLDREADAEFPMNKKACNNGRSDDPTKEATGCIFRGVCSKSRHVQRSYIESDFEVRPWNPLKNR